MLGVAAVVAGLCALLVWQATPPARPDDQPAPGRLAQCPSLTVPQGEEVPSTSACLFSEDAGRAGAELQVTSLTTEGDPVRTLYRRLPGEPGLEVVVDATEDALAGEPWSSSTCPDAVSLEDLGTCTPST